MDNNNDSEFEIIANKSFYIDYEPVFKEKKKKNDPTSNDTINKPTRKKSKKIRNNKLISQYCTQTISNNILWFFYFFIWRHL